MIGNCSTWRPSFEVRARSLALNATHRCMSACFLRSVIAASGVEDVRDVLDHYNQEPDPVQAFLLRQQQLLVSSFVGALDETH